MQNIRSLKIKQAESWARYWEAKKAGKTGRKLGAFKGWTTRRARAVSEWIQKQKEEARTRKESPKIAEIKAEEKESARIEEIRREANNGGHWFDSESLQACTVSLFRKENQTKGSNNQDEEKTSQKIARPEVEELAAIFERLEKLGELLARLKTTQKIREALEKIKAKAGKFAKDEETRGRIARERMQKLAAIFENLGQREEMQGLAEYLSGHLKNSGQVMKWRQEIAAGKNCNN